MTKLYYPSKRSSAGSESKFYLGKFSMTASASQTLDLEDVLIALKRHHEGDWGDLCDEDTASNGHRLKWTPPQMKAHSKTAGGSSPPTTTRRA